MTNTLLLPCDGCGQLADSVHISRRLTRLAWATRFRPLHIQALLLCGIAPKADGEFLYSPNGLFYGEARAILRAAQITTEGKVAETVLAEFQKLGLMLAHVLECPLEEGTSPSEARTLLQAELPATIARIRRSLKPKRVLLLSKELQELAPKFHGADLPCLVLPPGGGTFWGPGEQSEGELEALRDGLGIANARGV